MKNVKQFHNLFPKVALNRLLYGMQNYNAAMSFEDRVHCNEIMYANAETELEQVFEDYPDLKFALPKLYKTISAKKRLSAFSISQMSYLKRNKIFKKV